VRAFEKHRRSVVCLHQNECALVRRVIAGGFIGSVYASAPRLSSEKSLKMNILRRAISFANGFGLQSPIFHAVLTVRLHNPAISWI
jgi:hypothetical protein